MLRLTLTGLPRVFIEGYESPEAQAIRRRYRYKKGDRVQVIGYWHWDEMPLLEEKVAAGEATGVIAAHDEDDLETLAVAFSSYIGGHDLDGDCLDGYGWYVNKEFVIPMVVANYGTEDDA